MITSFSKFVASSLSVQDNAVKNIIFHAATIFLQLAITKFFAFLALRSNSYTSYLMYSENIIQKVMFAASRKFRPQALLVLLFALVFSVSNLYDTLLWGLDSPGYIIKSTPVTAASVADNLLTTPSYINFLSNPTRDFYDVNINDALTGNLYKPGFNFTFSDFTIPSISYPTTTPITNDSSTILGPRIWLDDEGFAVTVDLFQSFTTQVYCPTNVAGESTWFWKCVFPNHNSTSMLSQLYGQPLYWWARDNETDSSRYFAFNRQDNPWKSLGTGGDTAVMKHVFTLTKGNRRHTFLQSIVKISMLSAHPPKLDAGEITEMIRRTWSPNPNEPIDNVTQAYANFFVSAEANGTSASFGIYSGSADGNAVFASSIDLLHPTNAAADSSFGFNDTPLYSILRVMSTNITHIRSESLGESVEPFQPCEQPYENLAYGGKVTGTDCYKVLLDEPGQGFLGQLDSSAIAIITGIIGDGSQNTSAAAYSDYGWTWYSDNQGYIDSLILARGITLGGNAQTVTIDVKSTVPAVSYLQILLVVLPFILAVISLVTMMKDHGGYYSSSFLYAMSATTHLNTDSCTNIPFASAPPDIQLKYAGQHVVLQTGKGETVGLLSPTDSSPFLLSAEPLLNAKDV